MSAVVMHTVGMNNVAMNNVAASGAQAAGRVRLRLTRRGRAVLTMLVALPIVIGAMVFALNGGGAAATGEQAHVTFHYVTVQSGDSLWSVASRIAPNADPRNVIADLVNLNGLSSAVVTPGQQLAIPTQYDGK
ncbi:LysM peptidoglycan-binding domain-containing protein [Leifsonia sp. NPDC056665]|uniref:LysM peptidoglycan-binding domain-containing protein n=1 Tax=Leifsonia sp. NPDC056665 TaxID=3345901 RepID=UPI0036CFDAD0